MIESVHMCVSEIMC